MINLIFGPPGTGKTTYLLNEVVAKELKNTSPDKIGYFAFTQKAAQEALHRALRDFPKQDADDFKYFRTLHSLAFLALGLSESDVMNDEDYRFISQQLQVKLTNPNGEVLGYGVSSPNDIFMKVIDMSKINGVKLYDQFLKSGHMQGGWPKLKLIGETLHDYKFGSMRKFKYDFTDMIVEFLKEDIAPRLDVLIIDEAQDLSFIQWQMVDKLAEKAKRIYIAGDDDQAIFQWAGAKSEYLLNKEGNRIVLNKSYRLPVKIQQRAVNLINRVKNRVQKQWSPKQEEGTIVHLPRRNFDHLKEGNWLILGRTNYFLDQVEDELKLLGYYYHRAGKSSIGKRLMNAINGWRMLQQGSFIDHDTLKDLYYYMGANIGVERGYKNLTGVDQDATFSYNQLKENNGLRVPKDYSWHEALDKVPEYKKAYVSDVIRREGSFHPVPRITLSTVHGSKGGEADNVMILSDLSRKADESYWRDKDDERRVFYVALTRAKQTLYLVRSKTNREFREVFL
tara:strand:+ start:2826 stop:4349 length:1524 start_codon:yes stop_codon:yes gene_type:complete